ncbi:MAG: group 1 truncated hemoglobin [Alphaproteobacteria bacterium]|nr:group 1 truncated hemoglobin [Alphaproteobacteria bacterium]MDX5369657.1 group 1 truncated hemoglobin [Alphaproteobacteria bacterium]MDX5464292.1 group 1 truncated hemoglobin [Alphaproteobacteria bacterium]
MNATAHTPPAGPGVFERCGGFGRVSRMVMSFYDRVGENDLLAPYFEDIDMARLIDHQTKFFASMMGGPASFNDETLRRVHARLGISGEAFDEMAVLLRETLEDFDLDDDDIETVLGEFVRRRPLVVVARDTP